MWQSSPKPWALWRSNYQSGMVHSRPNLHPECCSNHAGEPHRKRRCNKFREQAPWSQSPANTSSRHEHELLQDPVLNDITTPAHSYFHHYLNSSGLMDVNTHDSITLRALLTHHCFRVKHRDAFRRPFRLPQSVFVSLLVSGFKAPLPAFLPRYSCG
ncbi:Hypothetical predicted protein [Pelobates cultripes]|uniref:Uncharacterized protein n=1 Tax=Pelobates cultripes TaxID=61616 RepID=A0AAD1R9I5_PELCU|nr:Hypothetical predicted protein [Pelobates cultripes]